MIAKLIVDADKRLQGYIEPEGKDDTNIDEYCYNDSKTTDNTNIGKCNCNPSHKRAGTDRTTSKE